MQIDTANRPSQVGQGLRDAIPSQAINPSPEEVAHFSSLFEGQNNPLAENDEGMSLPFLPKPHEGAHCQDGMCRLDLGAKQRDTQSHQAAPSDAPQSASHTLFAEASCQDGMCRLDRGAFSAKQADSAGGFDASSVSLASERAKAGAPDTAVFKGEQRPFEAGQLVAEKTTQSPFEAAGKASQLLTQTQPAADKTTQNPFEAAGKASQLLTQTQPAAEKTTQSPFEAGQTKLETGFERAGQLAAEKTIQSPFEAGQNKAQMGFESAGQLAAEKTTQSPFEAGQTKLETGFERAGQLAAEKTIQSPFEAGQNKAQMGFESAGQLAAEKTRQSPFEAVGNAMQASTEKTTSHAFAMAGTRKPEGVSSEQANVRMAEYVETLEGEDGLPLHTMPSNTSLIDNLFANRMEAAAPPPPPQAPAANNLVDMAEKIASQILVSESKNGEQEVRITLGEGTLKGTEFSIVRGNDGQLAVKVLCANAQAFQTAVQGQQSLVAALETRGERVRVTVENSGQESGDQQRRSRGLEYFDIS
ncbi:MAG: hypothetical protein IJS54_06005 [Desulfovibrio sp.]|nr:hypothetical protein [Desulfovibrio sp.]